MNPWFIWTSTKLMLDALGQIIASLKCHLHASYCCIWLFIDCRHRPLSIGSTPEGVPSTCLRSSASSWIYQASNPPPLEHFDKSHSLAPAPYTALGQQRFNCYFSAAIVEPIPLHDLSLP